MLRHERQEHHRPARPHADVQQFKPEHHSHPDLERADVEHSSVGDGQLEQEEVDGLAAHAWTQQHRRRRQITHSACRHPHNTATRSSHTVVLSNLFRFL